MTANPTNLTAVSDVAAKAVNIRRIHRSTSSDSAVIIRRKPRSPSVGIHSQGVALARSVIVAGDLREERLIRPLRAACATNYSYYLVYPAGLPLSQAASAFCHWLKNEVEDFQKKI